MDAGASRGLPGWSGLRDVTSWGGTGGAASLQLLSCGYLLAVYSRVRREDGTRFFMGVLSGRMRGNKARRWEVSNQYWEKKKELSQGCSKSGAGCPEQLGDHCPWRHSKLTWRETWVISCDSNYFEQELGLADLQRFLQTWMLHWFGDFFTIYSDTSGLVMAWCLHSELIQGNPVASAVPDISLDIFSVLFYLI